MVSFRYKLSEKVSFFTQIIINHFKQLCRTAINYKNLTLKYHQHLCETMEEPHLYALKNKNNINIINNANDNYSEFYKLQSKYNQWINWYNTQKKIFESVD